ncbi:MAG TPA: hypothetical protein VFU49_11465 [Ktedonobacteraceae bacterium]|nr:hypothetical protein [Ktedonobacteraceae bacterium]
MAKKLWRQGCAFLVGSYFCLLLVLLLIIRYPMNSSKTVEAIPPSHSVAWIAPSNCIQGPVSDGLSPQQICIDSMLQ